MTRNVLIANRIREVFLNGKWIANTNFKEQILSVNCEQANHQIGSLNTIALLTFHINYYLVGLIHVFDGGKLEIKDKYSFDMPKLNTEEDWNKLVQTFLVNAEMFANKVAEMNENKLDQAFVDEQYGTYSRNIEAVIEHSYYHLGQVALIKKLVVMADKKEVTV